ncbi:hypothetical protein ACEPAH_9147 [Sanghuangporus vaninii]
MSGKRGPAPATQPAKANSKSTKSSRTSNVDPNAFKATIKGPNPRDPMFQQRPPKDPSKLGPGGWTPGK